MFLELAGHKRVGESRLTRFKRVVSYYPFNKRVLSGLIFLIPLLNGSCSGWAYFQIIHASPWPEPDMTDPLPPLAWASWLLWSCLLSVYFGPTTLVYPATYIGCRDLFLVHCIFGTSGSCCCCDHFESRNLVLTHDRFVAISAKSTKKFNPAFTSMTILAN